MKARIIIADDNVTFARGMAQRMSDLGIPAEALSIGALEAPEVDSTCVIFLNTTARSHSLPELEGIVGDIRLRLGARVFLVTDGDDPVTRYLATDGGVSLSELLEKPLEVVGSLVGDDCETRSRESLMTAMRRYSADLAVRHFDLRLDVMGDHNVYVDADGVMRGVFVCTPCMVAVGTPVELSVELMWGESLALAGVVAWTREPRPTGLRTRPGLGVLLPQLEPRHRELMRRISLLRRPVVAPPDAATSGILEVSAGAA